MKSLRLLFHHKSIMKMMVRREREKEEKRKARNSFIVEILLPPSFPSELCGFTVFRVKSEDMNLSVKRSTRWWWKEGNKKFLLSFHTIFSNKEKVKEHYNFKWKFLMQPYSPLRVHRISLYVRVWVYDGCLNCVTSAK